MSRMKSLRTRLKWSQQQMATYLGVSQPTVARVELGSAESGPMGKLLDQLAARTPTESTPSAGLTPEAAA